MSEHTDTAHAHGHHAHADHAHSDNADGAHSCCGTSAAAPTKPATTGAGQVWTCPMHPEIRRPGPGACPICGMALEPLAPSAEEGESAELVDMTRRFLIGAGLSVPLLWPMLGEIWHAI